MPHFRTTIDPPAITITSAALGPDVWPSLKMARAALDDAVDNLVGQIRDDLSDQITALQVAAAEHQVALRAARRAALKVREADLPASPEATQGAPAAPVLRSPEGEAGPAEAA